MNEFIHNSRITKTITPKKQNSFYCSLDDQEFIDDENNPRCHDENSNKVLAKLKYKIDGSPKYLIRIDLNKKLFNPKSSLSDNRNLKLIDRDGADKIKFKEVNLKSFSMYLNFLRSNNEAWLNNAERECN